MNHEREQLAERYLEARLREQLGEPVDLSDAVLRRVYGAPRKIVPPPRRMPLWRPLAAAAAVLLMTGLAAWAIVWYAESADRRRAESVAKPDKPDTYPAPVAPRGGRTAGDSTGHEPAAPDQPKPEAPQPGPRQPRESTGLPQPPAPEGPPPQFPPGVTDPPGSFPDPAEPPPVIPDPAPRRDDVEQPPQPAPERPATEARKAVVVARDFRASRKDGLRVTRAGAFERLKAEPGFEFHANDRLAVSGWAELTLSGGALLRLDGEATLREAEGALGVELHSGACYADTESLEISTGEVALQLSGVAVIEARLRELDLHLLSGKATSGGHELFAGVRSRLGKDGFKRTRGTSWDEVRGEYRFVHDTPRRVLAREDFEDSPGTLWGGEVKEGVLAGPGEPERGIAFHLRQPVTASAGTVVRFRLRIKQGSDLVIQLGADENHRRVLKGVRGGQWQEIEIPLAEFMRTLDRTQPMPMGVQVRRFQIHGEDGDPEHIEIDWVEFTRLPG
ncbi:MAG: hypothetical protein KF696_07610 [Planctomycetes bacterium]|nr:hypothetical protein [Planctomycetota bacterium]MCW8135418.1 hypothetical protein [Planctomycetota bacterium]